MFVWFVCCHVVLVVVVCCGVSCYHGLGWRYPVGGIVGHGIDDDRGGVLRNVG